MKKYLIVEKKTINQTATYKIAKIASSLVLTPEITQQMTELYQIASGSEIEIAQQGEAVTDF